MKQTIVNLLPKKIYLHSRWIDFKVNRQEYFEFMQKKRTEISDAEPSYKPFDDTHSIFVHIPKCAGMSVSKGLYGNLAGGHTTLDQYINIFPPNSFLKYFKFTFVRNPWDRLVSAYFFLKNGGFNKYDSDFFKRELSGYSDFDHFVKQWLNNDNIMKFHHFKPQHYFIVDRFNRVSVDFVAYLENIEKDYDFIRKKIGGGKQLKKVNSSNHTPYQEFYSSESRDIVSEIYKNDIHLFDYEFNGPRSFVRSLELNYVKKILTNK